MRGWGNEELPWEGGVLSKKECHHERVPSRVKRREKGGVGVEKWEVKFLLRMLLHFY